MRIKHFLSTFRGQFLFGSAVCAALLGYALYAQHRMFLDPCPLCLLQRGAFLGMGVCFLAGGLHAPKGRSRLVYAAGVLICAAAGAGVASWHLWLQSLPADQVPACSGLGLGYMLEAFPLGKVIDLVFTGSGECALVDWSFLGISMPGWTLAWFLLLGAACVRAARRAG